LRSRAPQLRIAILGCGAVTELRYLPALATMRIEPALLVDLDRERAVELARRCGAARVANDYRPLLDEIDAAIVALPHSLHAPVSIDLLEHGVHVLVEKPLAVSVEESRAVLAAAARSDAVLAVGLMRRHADAARWLEAALRDGALGSIESFDFEDGLTYAWPVASGSLFRKETSGGGVLADMGAHTLDSLLWWLGDVAALEYEDDAYGGIEADARLELTLVSGARGRVELSRTRNLRNTTILRGERGTVEIGTEQGNRNQLVASPATLLESTYAGARGDCLPRLHVRDLFVRQIRDWLQAIEGSREPLVTAASAARGIELIERCYASRRLWELPWVRPEDVTAA